MNIKKDKYIILEIIPTNTKANGGIIIQLSALKIDELKLIERFDYRLTEDKLPIKELKSLINYDKESFTYTTSENNILEAFKNFSEQLPILILDNVYTKDFIKPLGNKLYLILEYLNLEYSNDVIENMIKKYHLEPSNHIVDLLYEALIMAQ